MTRSVLVALFFFQLSHVANNFVEIMLLIFWTGYSTCVQCCDETKALSAGSLTTLVEHTHIIAENCSQHLWSIDIQIDPGNLEEVYQTLSNRSRNMTQ